MLMIWEDIGSRPYMEDTYSFDVDLPFGFSYFGLFDGHGGADVSIYLRNHMKEVIKQHINNTITESKFSENDFDVPKILYESFKTIINNIPYRSSIDKGSTALVILKRKSSIWIGNVGDTRAVMNDGLDAVQLTNDHKPNEPNEYARITKLGGKVAKAYKEDVYRVNGVLAVSRAIGDFALSPHVTWKPEITAYKLHKNNHYIFVATDGVWDVLSSQQVVDVINEKLIDENWKDIGNTIIQISRNKGSGDNIACMFVIV